MGNVSPLKECTNRGDGLHMFGDMVYSFSYCWISV
jgi:hypothetical protein